MSKPRPEIENMTSLKVDNLTYHTTDVELREIYSKYGEIGDIYIPRNRATNESKGFAFVRFMDKKDAEDAMAALNGEMHDGREMRVQLAKYGRPDKPPPRDDGYGRDRGYDRDRRDYGRRDHDRRDYDRRDYDRRDYDRRDSRPGRPEDQGGRDRYDRGDYDRRDYQERRDDRGGGREDYERRERSPPRREARDDRYRDERPQYDRRDRSPPRDDRRRD
eukprot:m.144947 g.144947  ORF g.144947 m.144947 type:complete len:219 (+) comp14110_c0_seq4:1254-1910(+)